MQITITINATEEEVRRAAQRVRDALEQSGDSRHAIVEVDPQTLPRDDDRRYHNTGRVSDYGEREMIDRRTGRRGVYMSQMGMGFVKGAYVTPDGRVEFEHPSDNPFYGCDFRT